MKRREFLVFGSSAASVGATAATLGVLTQQEARAGGLGGFATEWTQVLNKVQLLQNYIRQGQELRQKILMVLDMAKNTLQLPMQVFGPLLAEIGALHTVVREGRALAYSMANLDTEFRNRFRGYGFRASSFYNEYRTWSETTLDTTLGTLKAANLQATQMSSEEGVLRQLRTMSMSSEGRLQAAQVGLQLSEFIAQSLMKLRQIMLADIQSKQAFQASEMQKGANQAASEERLFTPGPARVGSPRFVGGNN
jgi:type IV secretion system protein TrbJ